MYLYQIIKQFLNFIQMKKFNYFSAFFAFAVFFVYSCTEDNPKEIAFKDQIVQTRGDTILNPNVVLALNNFHFLTT